MKGCTNYTDEATRWGQPTGRKVTPLRIVLILACGVAAVLAAVTFWPKATDEGFTVAAAQAPEVDAAPEAIPDEQSDAASKDAEQADEAALLVIYLTGAVVQPGVYELSQGARANDAVELAGGLTDDSAANYVNLAAPLQDGQHVHIPSQAEVESGEAARIAAEGTAAGATGATGATSATGSDATGASAALGEQKVNINTAGSAELESLPGIGTATAQRIIDYREKNGGFKSVEDLKNVSGIGEKKYAELVDKVCV
jgi:competence protein ComEA